MLTFIIQDEIRKDVEIPHNFSTFTFSANDKKYDWKESLTQLDNNWNYLDNQNYVSFVSIPVARYISKNLPRLKHSLLMPLGFSFDDINSIFNWHAWHTTIPQELQLNNEGCMTTIKSIVEGKFIPKHEKVFCKPVSRWKPFTGFVSSAESLLFEMNSLVQIERLNLHELVLVTECKEISPIEWRCYVVDNTFITGVPYSWNEEKLPQELPKDVIEQVIQASKYLQEHYDSFVIDIAIHNDVPKVLEVNCVSTSGWYDGLDVSKIFSSISELYEI